MKRTQIIRSFCVLFMAVLFVLAPVVGVLAGTQDDIAAKNAQIEQIQQQIEQYQQQIDTIHSQAQTLQGEVNSLNAQIAQITLELKSLNLSISNTNSQIGDTQSQISDAEQKITKDDAVLAQYLLVTYQTDQESLVNILLKNNTLSDFFNDLNSVKTTQDNLKITIDSIKGLKTSLEGHEQDLEDQLSQLQQQQQLVQLDQRSLSQSQAQKAKLLKDTQGQESKFQQLVKQGQQNIAAIQQEIYYLEQNGVSVEDAIKYGNLSAIAVGIRPAFLLAELEIESGLGENVGKCYITDTTSGSSKNITTGRVSSRGINPTRDLPIFLQITRQLGRDPLQTPLSCWPGYGWGGAMGPAQFIPSTWVGYAGRVAQIVGRAIADPWNIEDAFTASAIKLANEGATGKTAAAEIAASKAYFSGNSRCSTAACNSYANNVQRVAARLEQNL